MKKIIIPKITAPKIIENAPKVTYGAFDKNSVAPRTSSIIKPGAFKQNARGGTSNAMIQKIHSNNNAIEATGTRSRFAINAMGVNVPNRQAVMGIVKSVAPTVRARAELI